MYPNYLKKNFNIDLFSFEAATFFNYHKTPIK